MMHKIWLLNSCAALSGIIGALTCLAAFTAQHVSLGDRVISFAIGLVIILICIVCTQSAKKAVKKERESISSCSIATVDSKTSTASAIARGAVGDLVAGPAGAVVGAVTAQKNQKTTFLIVYKDGKQSTKTYPNKSTAYKHYMKLLTR